MIAVFLAVLVASLPGGHRHFWHCYTNRYGNTACWYRMERHMTFYCHQRNGHLRCYQIH